MKNWREHLVALIIFTIASVLLALPIFEHFNHWGRLDWPQFYTWYDVPRTTILKYKQIPLWNPYSWGGNLGLGHTHDGTLSPFFLFVLVFGVVKGLKIWMVVSTVLGGWGMWALVRSFGAGKISSYFSGFVWALGGYFAMHFAVGHADHFTQILLPWLYLFYLKSLHNLRYALPAALVLILMAFSGNPYPFIISLLFLGFHSLICAAVKRNLGPIRSLVLILALTFFLGAVRFFPLLDMMVRGAAVKKDVLTGTDIYKLWGGLVFRGQELHAHLGNYGTWEFAAYIGLLPLAVFALALVDGFIRSMRKRGPAGEIIEESWLFSSAAQLQSEKWALAATGTLFFFLTLGDKISIDLLGILRLLPGLRFFHSPFRLIIVSILAICPWVGLFLTKWELPGKRIIYKALPLILSCILLGDLLSQNSRHFQDIFIIPPPEIATGKAYITDPTLLEHHKWAEKVPLLVADVGQRPSRQFSQKHLAENSAGLSYFASRDIESKALAMYLNFLQNVGTLDSYDPAHLPQYALGQEDEGYRGEAFMLSGEGSAEMIKFSPNKFIIKTSTSAPDTLIINQNFHPGWRAKGGRVQAHQGLISTKVSSGEQIITFYFLPLSFLLGVALTLATSVGLIVLFIRRKHKPCLPDKPQFP
ncbi:MAG: hypothetical protein AMS15_06545 [Planctomycetes bacterium DG_23]|nr:MAG: hypothetical protein AMS15_06545 [Planctomycetes bacterium DG_23]